MMTKKIDPDRRFYLREIRQSLGLTQEEVAAAVGATKGQISQLETGHTQFTESWIARLSAGLGIEPAFFLIPPGDESAGYLARLLSAWPDLSDRRRADLAALAESFTKNGGG